jgi:hypothetical protein
LRVSYVTFEIHRVRGEEDRRLSLSISELDIIQNALSQGIFGAFLLRSHRGIKYRFYGKDAE